MSSEELEKAIQEGVTHDSRGKSLRSTANAVKVNTLRTATGESVELPYSALVPEEGFRNLLNERGEIQLRDTLYCISPAGTFYTHVKNSAELKRVVDAYVQGQGERIREKTLKIGEVYLYETFANAGFESENDLEVDSDGVGGDGELENNLRATNYWGIPQPDLNSFEQVRARRQTIVGQFLQSTIIRNSFVRRFDTDNGARLNCAVFDYDYVLRRSIGVTAKIQKKMWHGWAQIKNWGEGQILIGYRYVIVKYEYPKDMPNVEEMAMKMPDMMSVYETDAQRSYLRSLSYPEWFKTNLVNVTIPVLKKQAKLSAQDVVSAVSDRVKSFMRAHARASLNTSTSPWQNVERLPDDRVDAIIKELKMQENIPMCVPVYAEDGIYMYYSGGWMTNVKGPRDRRPPTEITMRFVDQILEVRLDYRTGLDRIGFSFDKFKPEGQVKVALEGNRPVWESTTAGFQTANFGFQIRAARTGGELIEGDFYAAGYNSGEWVGFNLKW